MSDSHVEFGHSASFTKTVSESDVYGFAGITGDFAPNHVNKSYMEKSGYGKLTNNCWAHETAYPDGYETMKGGYLGHVHIKDVQADTPKAFLEVRPMGEGQLADQFQPMADALRADGYNGAISFESVYYPGDGNFETDFRTCIGKFKEHFG